VVRFLGRTGGVPLKCQTMGTRGRLRQPDDYRSRKRYRMGDEGKAVGVHPDGFAVFVALGQRSSTYLEIESNDTLTRTGPRASMPEFLGLSSNSKARRHLRRASFLLRD